MGRARQRTQHHNRSRSQHDSDDDDGHSVRWTMRRICRRILLLLCVARDADANSHPLLKRDRPRNGGAASLQFHQHPLPPLPPNATVDGNYARDWAVCAFHLFLHAGTQARGILYILVGQRKCLVVSSEDFSFPSALHFASFAGETVLLDPGSYCAR